MGGKSNASGPRGCLTSHNSIRPSEELTEIDRDRHQATLGMWMTLGAIVSFADADGT